jgi:hypothetical protein
MSKTVFVIGAGASVEFGDSMPVGSELANTIRECLTAELNNHRRGGATPIIDGLSYGGFHNQHEAAMRRIRDGITTKESIDDFVDEWRDVPFLADVAKAAISYCIASAESGTSLAGLNTPSGSMHSLPGYERPMTHSAPDRAGILASLRSSWLGCILRYHNARASRRSFVEALQDTSFVVFNYDRCIEQYLWHQLTTALAVPPEEARDILQSVPILHIFGSIGQLPELGGHHPFGAHDSRYLTGAAQRIRTYTESIDSLIGQRVASIMGSADKIVFLGCAFHDQNLRLLFPNERSEPAEVWGTCLGVRTRREGELKKYFGGFSDSPALIPVKAGQLLDDYRDDLF